MCTVPVPGGHDVWVSVFFEKTEPCSANEDTGCGSAVETFCYCYRYACGNVNRSSFFAESSSCVSIYKYPTKLHQNLTSWTTLGHQIAMAHGPWPMAHGEMGMSKFGTSSHEQEVHEKFKSSRFPDFNKKPEVRDSCLKKDVFSKYR